MRETTFPVERGANVDAATDGDGHSEALSSARRQFAAGLRMVMFDYFYLSPSFTVFPSRHRSLLSLSLPWIPHGGSRISSPGCCRRECFIASQIPSSRHCSSISGGQCHRFAPIVARCNHLARPGQNAEPRRENIRSRYIVSTRQEVIRSSFGSDATASYSGFRTS
ncbi:hypothetical protein ZHAS_00017375 [Anopheles sinensis]|uniref:Uncharacterized protein n=1 Tax=Anopheles sinensis TaxID=74873 RepID=A0A084WGC0_ANOSI|nr:hypothetical protein ZHAS_00017375 [Anopheles sinensis]